MLAADRAELAGGLDDDLREVARSRGTTRPTSVRASSSRSATSRRMRCEERSAERAASPCSPCSDSASSSRFASTLVSGVRSSCEASATNCRWRASVDSVSERAASSSRSIPSSVRASSATSSSACGWGTAREGSRVRAISAAVDVSSAIGAIARRAITIPASSASAVPASTPSSRNSSTRATVASVSETLRPYWIIDLPDRLVGAGDADDPAAADHAVAVDRPRLAVRRAEADALWPVPAPRRRRRA